MRLYFVSRSHGIFRRAPSDPYKHPGPPAWTARTQASFGIPHATHCAFLTLPVWSRETFRGRSVTIEELECSILARPCTVPVCAVSRRNRDGGTRIVGAQRAVPRRGSSARNPATLSQLGSESLSERTFARDSESGRLSVAGLSH